jgi:hypothetical protein
MIFGPSRSNASYLRAPSFFCFLLFLGCSKDSGSNGESNRPPGGFSLIQVQDRAEQVSLLPELSWTNSTDPEGDTVTYQLLLQEGTADPTAVIERGITATQYTIANPLKFNTPYSWKVIAEDGKGGKFNSAVFSFTTRANAAPTSFNLLEVVDQSSGVSLRPELSWEAATDPDGDVVSYAVLLDSDSDIPTTRIAENLSENKLTLTEDLEYLTDYTWQVLAIDSQGNETASQIYRFTTLGFQETRVTGEAPFSTRSEHSLLEFQGKLWVFGGYHASNNGVNGGLLNDVWSSADGITWTEEVLNDSSTSFTPRTNHASAVFQDKIWIFGGGDQTGILNDIWSSPDGVNWTLEIENAAFSPRYAHTATVFDGKLWIIGGEDGVYESNDVWSSTDGVNWTLETDNAAFPARYHHTSVVFQDRMWVIAGINSLQGSGFGDLNDVWSSTDGINWTLETINAQFSPRRGHSSAVFRDRIWVIAGNLRNDLWSSKDGKTWKEETEVINFSGRGYQPAEVFQDKLWVVGGWAGSLLNDVWYFD